MKVSVVMISYNHEKFIKDALEGILMQLTNFDFNIVIRDDASTDKTNEIIQEYVEKFPDKFDYKSHSSNIGMMPNFINALQSCESDYIALCEGDDYWIEKNKLQKQVSFLDSHQDYVGCFHNVNISNEATSNVSLKPWRTYNKTSFELTDTFSKVALFHTCSFVFRKEALEIPSWFKKVKSGDMALFSIVGSQGKLKLIDEVMAVYRNHNQGVTSGQKLKSYHKSRIALWKFVNKYYNRIHEKHLGALIKFHRKEIFRLYVKGVKRRLKWV